MSNTSQTLIKKSETTIDNKELIMFAIGMFALSVGGVQGSYLTFFWTDIALLPLAAVSSILFLSRLLDGVTDIIIGFAVDRTKSKHGKARPWLLWMALPATLSLISLFYVPNISTNGKVIYAFVTYNLVAFFFSTCVALPLGSLTALITTDAKQRLNLNMVGQAFGTSAIVLGNLFVVKSIAALGGGQPGYFKFFGLTAIISGALILVAFSGTKEKVVRSTSKLQEKITVAQSLRLFIANKWFVLVTLLQVLAFTFPALMGINMYYMTWIMKNPALMGPFMSTIFVALLLALIVFAPLIPRVGKITAGFMGMGIQALGGLLPLINPTSVTVIMVSAALRGIGPAIMLGTRFAFICDVVEYGEWKTGIRSEGLIFSGASMGQKIGMGLGAAVVALVLARGGYVGGAPSQTPEALSAITLTFTWLSAASSILVTICLYFLRGLDKQMPQIMQDLNERKGIVTE
ncbi:MAG: glycoside-pentoside-hexuronide (GPH):cation symporter [Firmicutes bacterium]|nr:glycoside-pentoside-hexuronide (GPH):cation symporter [Bacillota bacterium]